MSVQQGQHLERPSAPGSLWGVDSLRQLYPFSRWAISRANWLIMAAFASVGSAVIAVGVGIHGAWVLIGIGLLGEISAGLALLVASAAGASSGHRIKIVLAWCAAAAARSLAVGLTFVYLSPAFVADPVPGIVTLFTLMIAAVLMQAVVSGMLYNFDTCDQRRRQVEVSINNLRATNEFARERVLAQRQEIAATYTDLVIPQIDTLVREVDRLEPTAPSAALAQLAGDCGENAREHVRQLSHAIAAQSDSAQVAVTSQRGHITKGILRVLPELTPPVVLTALLGVCLRLPGAANWGVSGMVPRLALMGVSVLAFLVVVAWGRRFIPGRGVWGALYLVGSLVAFWWFEVWVHALGYAWFPVRDYNPSETAYSELLTREQAGSMWLLGAACGATVIWAAQISSNRANARRLHTEEQLARTQRELDDEIRRLREESARLLHGSVQGRLAMAGVLFRECAAAGDEQTKSLLIQRIRDALIGAKSDLLGTRVPVRREHLLQDRLNELTAQWQGLLDITWQVHLNDGENGLPPGDPLVAQLHEIAAEAVANASRHGQASAAHVRIDVDEEVVTVVISDDGSGPGSGLPEQQPGLGSRWLESYGGDFRLIDNDKGGATLEVILDRTREDGHLAGATASRQASEQGGS